MTTIKEQGLEIFNNLPYDLQYYIQKMEERDDLHKRLIAAQKNLEKNFIRFARYNDTDGWDDYETKNRLKVCISETHGLVISSVDFNMYFCQEREMYLNKKIN